MAAHSRSHRLRRFDGAVEHGYVQRGDSLARPARLEFLQRYVRFRREYRELDFHVVYQSNGGGRVPGPSDWDIRLVAIVPPEELASWVPAGATTVSAFDSNWLDGVPGAERAATVTEWYSAPGRIIGVDRVRSIVAYHSWSR